MATPVHEFDPAPHGPALTPEEVDVLLLIVKGESDKRIALQLHMSRGQVSGAVRHILEELGALNRTHAAAIAAGRYGLQP
jgi:DNA-binding NarL/FixJ family response regulator